MNHLKKYILIFLLGYLLTFLQCECKQISDLQEIKNKFSPLVETNFPNMSLKPWRVQANQGDIEIVPNPTKFSKNVMKAHINIDEDFSNIANGSPRAEILDAGVMIINDSEYLIKFKTYLPKDFQFETNYSNPSIFFQVHQQDIYLGSPPFAMEIDKGQYVMTSMTSPVGVPKDFEFSVIPFGKIKNDLGKWVDWKVFYKPSHSERGRVIIWKNGALVLDYTGCCAYNNSTGYLKFGIYKWNWKRVPSTTTDVITYFADIHVCQRK